MSTPMPHALARLRPCSERPRSSCAAEERNELTPLQSIELHLTAQPRSLAEYRIDED
jgi:hypothetical protein